MDPDIFDLVQQSVVLRDRDGRITRWNAASEQIYGWSQADAVGKPIHDLLKTRRDTTPLIEQGLRDAGRWEGDVERRAANGVIKTIRLKCVLSSSAEIVETGADVSVEKRLGDALSRAEHRYTNVFRAMAVSFWELDFTAIGGMVQRLIKSGVSDLPEHFAANPAFVREMIRATQVIDVNDLSVSMFGRGEKEEMLASLEPYWPESSFPVYAAAVVAAVQGKPHFAAETRLSSIGGREFDVWFTACFPPEMLARGKLLIGILDISADKSAKTALEMSEERYRSLFHFLPVAMLQVDRRELADVFTTLQKQGVRDLEAYFKEHPGFYEYAANSIQVIEVNQRAIELFRARSACQLIGPAARVWSEARDTIQASMVARFSGAARFEAEMKIRAFDNQTRDALYVAHFPEAYERDALGLISILDISDRVEAQAKLSRMQAEFAHAARVSMLGELTASIAHEVNQPLGAILTSGETAIRWLDRPEPNLGELRALAARTVSDARRAGEVIRRIRSMASYGEPELVALALNDVVEEVMMFLGPELKRQALQATLDLAPDLPCVRGDRVQLQQVLANLTVNALQAMAGQGEPRLLIRTAMTDPRTVCAVVEDNGPGIPPNQLHHLFQSFFTTKKGGMGIGLAICRSIVEAHGGRLEAVNLSCGAGARFRFTLPAFSDESLQSSRLSDRHADEGAHGRSDQRADRAIS
jgi:PAS domain S-box-containing protein